VVHPRQRPEPRDGRRSSHRTLTYAAAIAPVDDDTGLVTAARAGDRTALDALLRHHYDRLWRVCRRVVGDDQDAQDALQNALVAIARGIRNFDGRSSFGTWSYRIATNASLDELRRRARRPLAGGFGAGPGDDDVAGVFDRLPGAGATGPALVGGRAGFVADGGMGAVVERLDVDEALARVPEPFRVAVVLRDLCDLDYAEIARIIDVPVGTVRSRIARGRAVLADLLGNPAPASDRPTTEP
jgi:RNA polymerase sigma-70 factor, ECF subfamily